MFNQQYRLFLGDTAENEKILRRASRSSIVTLLRMTELSDKKREGAIGFANRPLSFPPTDGVILRSIPTYVGNCKPALSISEGKALCE